jgi:Resolvase, N terminal domain
MDEPPKQAKAIPKSLQDAAEEFYMWMGYCIGAWASVDELGFRILWKTLGTTEQKAAIVYFRSPSLDIRVHLIDEIVLSDLQAKGVDLFLFQQGLDTSTPSGRAMFQMLGVFSEFEAAMIRERVRTGITRAKRNGTKSGRPIGRPRLGRDQEVAAQKLLRDGMGILKVARTLKIGTGTVSRISAQLRK